jgi:hypothetical protein
MAVISIGLNPRPSESSAVKIRIGIRVYSRSFAVKIGTNPRSSGHKAPPTKTSLTLHLRRAYGGQLVATGTDRSLPSPTAAATASLRRLSRRGHRHWSESAIIRAIRG